MGGACISHEFEQNRLNDVDKYGPQRYTQFKVITRDEFPSIPKPIEENLDFMSNQPKVVGYEYKQLSPLQFSTGDIYWGDWGSNKMNGKGLMIFYTGSAYIGDWKDGKADGEGTLVFQNGDIYIGSFQNNCMHGEGTLSSGKYTYKGQWKNDKMHGKCQIFLNIIKKNIQKQGNSENQKEKCVTIFEGQFQDGVMNGEGIIKVPGKFTYTGNICENKLQGEGKIKFNDDREYEGDFVNNKLEGQGTFKWPKGLQYTGGYQDNKKHGQGKLDIDGKKAIAFFNQGEIEGEANFIDSKNPNQECLKQTGQINQEKTENVNENKQH